MSVPGAPVYLPGGKAMVRDVDGALSFVADAADCCCQGCPTECAHCADTYYLSFTGSGDCNCDYDYTLSRVVSPPCKWYQLVYGIGGSGTVPSCVAEITCIYGWWFLTITNNEGVACKYYRAAMRDECPAGVYTYSSGLCSECPPSVTVTVAPVTTTTAAPTTTPAPTTTTTL